MIKKQTVIPHALEVDNLNYYTYSKFLTRTSNELWDHITTDKALIFQTDSVFCLGTTVTTCCQTCLA